MRRPAELRCAPFSWQRPTGDAAPRFVSEWVEVAGEALPACEEQVDVLVWGVPLSRTSISASAASEHPLAFRRLWRGFATYNIDEDVNLAGLRVVDVGDVIEHVTDSAVTHEAIEQTARFLRTHYPEPLLTTIGGDHSITACVVRGMQKAEPSKKIGIIQLDTHFDLRDPAELGKANGTPIRQLVEEGVVSGQHVYTIGLHGFFNGEQLKEVADRHGIHYYTMKQTRKRGLAATIADALAALATEVDDIYVTVDMDVLDISHAPGVPASTPGGMYTDELLDAVLQLGAHPKVAALDIVCLDPRKDVHDATVKIAVHTWLNALVGLYKRTSGA
ncbi:agmatinase family protein [Bacillus sp. FSL W7-1360]